MPREQFQCKWGPCDKSFEAVEDLFSHLTDEHVGRKSTNNLCLECHWENCNTVAAKRDHLASHLRVHLPLKPHHCQLCNKGFKRPQDLKKHERIHTIEHQSSLLSNQPGYKPQRRRRKPAQSTPSQKGSSEISELSSCSPSFLSMSPGEHDDNQKSFQDPLNGFINDILMEQAQPTYDADMMNRLNSIVPALQYQTPWNVPCTPESVPTLQNWLEQLSSNIQTDENMYPTILTPPTVVVGNPPVVDYDLYPKLNDNNEWTTPSFTTHSEKTVDSPTTPPMTQVTPREEKESEIKPNFWTPGYITNDTYRDATMMDGPYPSEAVDFSTMIRPSCSVEPNTNFETTKQEADVLKPGFDTSTTYEEKKSLMHMINQFNSPYDDAKAKVTNSLDKQKPSVVVIDETEGNKGNADDNSNNSNNNNNNNNKDTPAAATASNVAKNGENEEKKETKDASDDAKSDTSNDDDDNDNEKELASSSNESSRRSSISSSNYSYVYPNDQHDKSPYNELLDSIENMNLEDEETTRKRHLKLIDDLYKLISQMS